VKIPPAPPQKNTEILGFIRSFRICSAAVSKRSSLCLSLSLSLVAHFSSSLRSSGICKNTNGIWFKKVWRDRLTPAFIAPQVSKALLPCYVAFLESGGKTAPILALAEQYLQNCSSNFCFDFGLCQEELVPSRSSPADPETTPNQPTNPPSFKKEQIDCIETTVNNSLFPVFFYQVCGGFHFFFPSLR